MVLLHQARRDAPHRKHKDVAHGIQDLAQGKERPGRPEEECAGAEDQKDATALREELVFGYGVETQASREEDGNGRDKKGKNYEVDACPNSKEIRRLR